MDLHTINDVVISNNQLTLTETSLSLPSPSRIQLNNTRFATIYNFENVAFEDNTLTSNVQGFITNAISAILDDGVSISRNDISGFMGFGIENSSSDNMIIDGNRILDWGGLVDYFAILVANSDNVVVSSNDVESPASYSGAINSNNGSSNVHFVANRMIADRDFSIAGTQYTDLLLTNGTTAFGNSLANYIRGNSGSNLLDGGGGADTLQGLGGNDTYYVDDTGDLIIEAANGGARDVVYSSVNYTLGVGARVEVMSSVLNASNIPQNLTGNGFVQDIVGNAGANVLDGGGGRDSLQGLGGDDVYIVRQGDEIIYESVNAGTDEIRTLVNFTLAASTHVEKLSTTDAFGVAALNLTGNGFAQEIVGNAGANVLDGGGGADTLQGLGGSDTFRFTGVAFGNDTIVDYESGLDKISFSLAAADSFDDLVVTNNGTSLVTVSVGNQNILVASSSDFTIDSNDFLFV